MWMNNKHQKLETVGLNCTYDFDAEHWAATIVEFILEKNKITVEVYFVANLQSLDVYLFIGTFNLDQNKVVAYQ